MVKNNLLSKFKELTQKKLLLVGLMILTIMILATGAYYIYSVVYKPTTNINKVEKSNVSTVSVKTGELIIEEWGLKMSVNNNILGNVSYSIISDKSLRFNSSKLNNLDLTSAGCESIKRDSWGFDRLKENPSKDSMESYAFVNDYYISSVSPDTSCDKVTKIDSAFHFMLSSMEKL